MAVMVHLTVEDDEELHAVDPLATEVLHVFSTMRRIADDLNARLFDESF